MVSHHPAKFGGKRHRGTEDMSIPANTVIFPHLLDICDCLCPLTSAIIIFSKAHGMSCATRVTNNN